MSWKVVIADDQPGMRLALSKIIERAEGFTLVGQAENGEQALEMVEEFHPHVVFLDVEMPVMSGIESGRRIQDFNPKIKLVFATAHEEYMSEAFSLYAFDYMIKPFKVERVMHTLARVRDLLEMESFKFSMPEQIPAITEQRKPPSRLIVRHKDGVSFIDTDSIRLIQRENRATVLITTEGEHTTSESLGELEARLDPNRFFRCHKSYIINIDYIDNITPYGRWTHIVRLKGTQKDALITHEKFEELQKIFAS